MADLNENRNVFLCKGGGDTKVSTDPEGNTETIVEIIKIITCD